MPDIMSLTSKRSLCKSFIQIICICFFTSCISGRGNIGPIRLCVSLCVCQQPHEWTESDPYVCVCRSIIIHGKRTLGQRNFNNAGCWRCAFSFFISLILQFTSHLSFMHGMVEHLGTSEVPTGQLDIDSCPHPLSHRYTSLPQEVHMAHPRPTRLGQELLNRTTASSAGHLDSLQ